MYTSKHSSGGSTSLDCPNPNHTIFLVAPKKVVWLASPSQQQALSGQRIHIESDGLVAIVTHPPISACMHAELVQ